MGARSRSTCLWRSEKGRSLILGSIAFVLIASALGCADTTTVVLRSTPPGATVSEAKYGNLGTTQEDADLNFVMESPYLASLVFKKPGYEEWRVEQKIEGPRIVVHAKLEEAHTFLTLLIVPPDAKAVVTFDGAELPSARKPGQHGGDEVVLDAPRFWQDKETGRVHVRITKEGYETIDEEIEVKRYQDNRCSYTLKRKGATLDCTSLPPGVDVSDRTLGYLGRTPLTVAIRSDQVERIPFRKEENNVARVQLQLRFEKEGFKPLERVEWIALGGEPNRIQVQLEND